jgi:hypothetical protein
MITGVSTSANAVGGEGLREVIRRRAEQIYIESGRIPNRDCENWAKAEREVCRERTIHLALGKNAVIIKVNGVEFVGEFDRGDAGGYVPGEFKPGAAVSVRFEGNKMFVRRTNGEELATCVVKKIG